MVELERAFTEGELTAWYQPVVSLVDGMMRGAEALVRWQHPQHGWLEPAAFMPAIVQAGLSSELGLHMMQTVMQQQRRLADLPVHGLKIDGSFIAGLPADDNSRAIVEATLGLGARLGLRVLPRGGNPGTAPLAAGPRLRDGPGVRVRGTHARCPAGGRAVGRCRRVCTASVVRRQSGTQEV